MADYSSDIVSLDLIDAEVDDFGPIALVWFFEEPPVPPNYLDDIDCDHIIRPLVGRDESAKYAGNIITGGKISYFKLGEGGWSPSNEITENSVAIGDGTSFVSGTVSNLPIVNTKEIKNILFVHSSGYEIWDQERSSYDGFGDLIGSNGSIIGEINYKTGEFSFDVGSSIPGGTTFDAYYKIWGRRNIVSEDIDKVGGSVGPFNKTLFCYPVLPSSVVVSDCREQMLTDDGSGNLVGDGSGTINYETGEISVTFNDAVYGDFATRVTWIVDSLPDKPIEGMNSLFADGSEKLFSYKKDIDIGDIVFQGVGSGEVKISLELDLSEANDDGNGYSPYFYEGGIFSENDVLLYYFTIPKFKKNSSVIFSKIISIKREV